MYAPIVMLIISNIFSICIGSWLSCIYRNEICKLIREKKWLEYEKERDSKRVITENDLNYLHHAKNGNNVYVLYDKEMIIRMYEIPTNKYIALTPPAIPTMSNPTNISIDKNGKYIYVGNESSIYYKYRIQDNGLLVDEM